MSVPTQQTLAHLRNNRPVYDMVLPFNPNNLLDGAQRRGMSKEAAQEFAHLALRVVREVYASTGRPVSAGDVSRGVAFYARRAREEERKKEEEEKMKKKGEGSVGEGMESEVGRLERKRGRDVEIEEVEEHGARRKRFKFSEELMKEFFNGRNPYEITKGLRNLTIQPHKGRDILSPLCENIEIATNIGRFLSVKDILNLYATSKSFHDTVNGHLLSTVRTWIDARCPEAGKVFSYQLYKKHLVPDPVARTWGQLYNIPGSKMTMEEVKKGVPLGGLQDETARRPAYSRELHQTRAVPGMKYLQLVTGRSRFCSQMLAMLARNGHRTPRSMHATLLRLWLLLEIPTSALRQSYLKNTAIWTDVHLYNAQMLFIKLGMHFNDPIYGPNTYELLHLMMGQKGLYPLWQLLFRKKYTTLTDVLELRVRYDFQIPPDHWGYNFFDRNVHGVPFAEIGTLHLEGWGKGHLHLMRPDELVPMEAVRRGLQLERHLMQMVVWGYIDWKTGENLVPSWEEMEIEDEGEVLLKGVDTHHHWKRRHVMKKRWGELSEEEKRGIKEFDEDERLRAMGWCGDDIDDYDSPYESDEEDGSDDGDSRAGLDDEIERGYILRTPPPQEEEEGARPPGKELTEENLAKWRDFGNEVLIGMPVSLGEDESLRAQGWWNGSGAEWEIEEGERREVMKGRRGEQGGRVGFVDGEALFVGVGLVGEEGNEEEVEEEWEGLSEGVEEEEEDAVEHSPFSNTEEETHETLPGTPSREHTPAYASSSEERLPATPPRKSGFTPINSPSQHSTKGEDSPQDSIYDFPPQQPGAPDDPYGFLDGVDDGLRKGVKEKENDNLVNVEDGSGEIEFGISEGEVRDHGENEGQGEADGRKEQREEEEVVGPMWTWPQVMDGEDGGYDSEASTVKMVSYD